MIALPDTTWASAYLKAAGRRPVYYVRIVKSEGPLDPDGAVDTWPGSSIGTTQRWYTTGAVDWSNAASGESEGWLVPGRLNRKSISDVSFQAQADSEPGGVADVSEFKFDLDNTGGYYQELEDNGIHFEGREIELWLTFRGVTDYTKSIKLFTGYVSSVKLKKNAIEIRGEGRETRQGQEVPVDIFQNETADYWTETMLPESAVGRPVPLVIGSHDMVEGIVIQHAKVDSGTDRGRVVQFAATEACGNSLSLKSFSNLRYGDKGLVEATGGFADINGAAGKSPWRTASSNAMAIFDDLRAGQNLYLKLLIEMKTWVANQTGCSGVVNPRRAIDGLADTYAEVPAATDASADARRNVVFKIPDIGLGGTIEGGQTNQQMFFVGRLVPEATASKWRADFDSPPYEPRCWGAFVDNGASVNGFGFYTPVWASAGIAEIDNVGNPSDYELYQIKGRDWCGLPTEALYDGLDDLSNGFFGVGVCTVDGASDTGFLRCYHAALWVLAYIDFPSDGYYAEIDGYEDTGGTITGTADLLIENPAHVLAFLWSYLGLGGSSTVDITGHRSVASGDRSGWKIAANLTEQKDLEEYVGELARETLLWSWSDETGQRRVFPMSDPGPSRLDFTLQEADVENGRLDQPTRSDVADVVTDFVFRFKTNPIRDEYDEQVVCNGTESSSGLGSEYEGLCAWGKYNYGGLERKKVFDFNWIRDRATMLEIAKLLIRWYTTRRWKLTWTGDLGLVPVQLGDSFMLDQMGFRDQPASIRSATYRITGKRHDPKTDTIKFTAVQVFSS